MKNLFKNDTSKNDYHILVVDDDGFLRDLLQRYLNQLGYFVSMAENGNEAIDLSQKQQFEIGLIDIVLSGMNGIELVDQLREIHPDMILIMMTGHPSMETALEALKRGVQDYLVKPFKLEQLEKVLERCLTARKILMENKRLKIELDEARAKLSEYENLVRHPHRLAVQSGEENPLSSRGDAVYRIQSQQGKKRALQERMNKLIHLKEEGVINEDEFEIRRKHLTGEEAHG